MVISRLIPTETSLKDDDSKSIDYSIFHLYFPTILKCQKLRVMYIVSLLKN